MTDSTYQYEPLPDDFIRLLHLIPGENEDPVTVQLVSVPLGEAPSFEALSYVWGDRLNTTEIECGQRPFSIRTNLRDALYHLRHPTEIKLLWADAICINQEDDAERSRQVRLMGLIYWTADRVIVWLGMDDDACPASEMFSLIRDVSELASKQLTEQLESGNAMPEVSLEELSQYDVERWKKFGTFVETHNWFYRGWVIQELGLAADAWLICGKEKLAFEDYLPFVRWIVNQGVLLCRTFRISMRPQYLATDYWLSTKMSLEYGDAPFQKMSFLEVLGETRSAVCSDSRDYVYAFLGHPSAFEAYPKDPTPYRNYTDNFFSTDRKPIVEPDYGKMAEQVYADVARNLMKHYGNLDVLSYVSHTHETIQDKYPSWAPRWNVECPLVPLSIGSYYSTSANSAPVFSFQEEELHILGMEFDVVDWVGHVPEDFSDGLVGEIVTVDDILENRLDALWNTYKFRLWQRHGASKRPDREAFLYTLTAGLIGYKPAEDHVAEFRANVAAFELQKINSLNTRTTRWRADPQRIEDLGRESKGGDASRFLIDVQQMAEYRSLFITKSGRIGLVNRVTEVGDRCCILSGGKTPYILRRVAKDKYKLVAEAYIHGVMRGEAFREGDMGNIVLI
ncbi:HET-domain-containing protein [Zopfia rhizophila CBS 207.26]|uniref:HET-domain-containing protein n=1 Tax=Zopfia rhizophila CBS 207.26 TaxID=1314779 RepID=A0A6A6DSF7_9PEZI|nr:HET-domain-containing protein [Zopfia rhizophila CBS 207.26]